MKFNVVRLHVWIDFLWSGAGISKTLYEWLVRLMNEYFDTGAVPMDWRGACIVPLYKGKSVCMSVETCEIYTHRQGGCIEC